MSQLSHVVSPLSHVVSQLSPLVSQLSPSYLIIYTNGTIPNSSFENTLEEKMSLFTKLWEIYHSRKGDYFFKKQKEEGFTTIFSQLN